MEVRRIRTGEWTIAQIRLRENKANAINGAFLEALNRALDMVADAEGLILTGQGRYFSVGFDLREVFPRDRRAMGAFMATFIGTLRRILVWPGPTVAAINGHALGGGFLLALACDHRLAVADERIRIGFPDVERQVPLSHSLRMMALHALPASMAHLVNGRAANFTPREAARRGLVELVDRADPVEAAVAWIERQPADYARRKAERLAPLLARLDALGPEDVEHFLDQWFAPETRAAFRKVWERVKRRA